MSSTSADLKFIAVSFLGCSSSVWEGSGDSLFKGHDRENSQGGEREGRLGRGELPSKCVEVKVVWMGVVRVDVEGFLLWGIILRNSGEWLLAVVKMEILLGVPVMQFVVLFLREWGWVECISTISPSFNVDYCFHLFRLFSLYGFLFPFF